MPIYEYRCRDCGKDFEELVSLRERENPSCPDCGSHQTERKMSVFGSTGGTKGGGASCDSSKFR